MMTVAAAAAAAIGVPARRVGAALASFTAAVQQNGTHITCLVCNHMHTNGCPSTCRCMRHAMRWIGYEARSYAHDEFIVITKSLFLPDWVPPCSVEYAPQIEL